MGNSADDLAVLQNGAAAHALNDAAGGGKEFLVGYLYAKVAAFCQVIIDFGDADGIKPWFGAGDGAKNLGFAHLNTIFKGNGIGYPTEICGSFGKKTGIVVGDH